MYVYIYIFIYVRMYVCMYVCMHVGMHVCVYLCCKQYYMFYATCCLYMNIDTSLPAPKFTTFFSEDFPVSRPSHWILGASRTRLKTLLEEGGGGWGGGMILFWRRQLCLKNDL